MPTHLETLAFGCRTAVAELRSEHIRGANLHRGYSGSWNLQYSSFSRASRGHCQPSAFR